MISSFFSLALLAAAAAAQNLAPCAQSCFNDMVQIAQSQFGCKSGDIACYCAHVDFGYGVRDCASQACSPQDATAAIAYGSTYCSGAVSTASLPASSASALSVLQSGVPSESTPSSSSPSVSVMAVMPISTSALESTITSGGSTFPTTTGFSTLFSSASGESSLTNSAASSTGSASSSVESKASSVVSSPSSKASSAASSVSSHASSAASSASSAASSTALAPRMTAAPILGVAGMAALLFV